MNKYDAMTNEQVIWWLRDVQKNLQAQIDDIEDTIQCLEEQNAEHEENRKSKGAKE